MAAVIYARYSTDNQTENSIETQVAACKRYAANNNLIVVDVYTDEALSGMKTTRAGLESMVEAAQAGQFSELIIYDQSRLARDLVDWFTLRKFLEVCNISLHSASGERFGDFSDPNSFMVEGVQALFNQLHVLTSRKKTIEGMRNIASKGLFAGGSACLGYDIVDKQYIINEKEAATVRLIFEMYASGCSYNDIITTLNPRGHRTKAGRTFGTNSLYSILTNERYIGVFVHGKTSKNPNGSRNSHKVQENIIRIEGAIPPIIDDEVWRMVRVRMDPRKNSKNKATVDYLLSGKIFCGHCGGAMCGEKRKENYYYYVCSTRKRLKTCGKKAVRKEYIEDLVINKIRSTITSENIADIAQGIYNSMSSVHDTIAPMKDALKSQIGETKRKIDNINNAIADGIYSSSTISKLKELEGSLADMFIQLSDLNKSNVVTGKTLEEIKEVLSFGISSGDKLIITMLVEKVICYDDDDFELILNPCGVSSEVRIPRVRGSSHHHIAKGSEYSGPFFFLLY